MCLIAYIASSLGTEKRAKNGGFSIRCTATVSINCYTDDRGGFTMVAGELTDQLLGSRIACAAQFLISVIPLCSK